MRAPTARSPARRAPSNGDIAALLREIAIRLDMAGVPFKPRAFEKAAYAVEARERPLDDVYRTEGLSGIDEIPGVGTGIARRIREALETGRIQELEELRRKTPVDVLGLSAVEGLGPKTILALHEALGVRTLEDVAQAARAGRIRDVPRCGEKLEQKILRGIEFLSGAAGRVPLGAALRIAGRIESALRRVNGVERLVLAGSLRRHKETIGDIDLLAAAVDPEAIMSCFAALPEVTQVYARGSTKTLVRLAAGIDADLRVVPPDSFGAALVYFTGSKNHNVALRRVAQAQGLKVNEYGVFRDGRRVAGDTEESVYAAVGLPWIPPEIRENQGEIEAARDGRLPRLIEADDLRGDLQIQTRWTDGANTIEEMAAEARRLGREYIAITDHARDLPMARGCDGARFLRQGREIRALNRRLKGIRILAGAELNIRKDGTLDIEDDVLARLDVVGAGIHSHFHLSRDEMTARLIRAMENPHVDILFHPTARVIGRRPPIEFDVDAVLEAAKRTGTALELDAHPERLDLKDEHVRRAIQKGVNLVVSSDAHNVQDLHYLEDYGVGEARRGWAEKKDVLTTLPLHTLRARLKRP